MGLKTHGILGIIGGILHLLSIMASIAIAAAINGISVSDVLNPAIFGEEVFTLIVVGIVMNTVSALVLVIAGILLASGKGRIPLAISMIVFGVLGIVFALVSIGGIIGIIGGALGVAGGALSRKEIQRQEAPAATSALPPPPSQ